MKKIVLGVATISLAVCAFSACGESEEERFAKAKENFHNFTVTVMFKEQSEDPYSHKLEVDENALKLTLSTETSTTTGYYKQQNGSIYCYQGAKYGWEKTSFNTINEILSREVSGYVSFFQQFFYDDFEKDGDYLKMTSSALEGYSTKLGATLSSAKLTLDGSHFNTATAIIQEGSMRMQIDYKFEKYGSTSVTLPE